MSIGDLLGSILAARVIYRSSEEAERETGYFKVNSVKVTADLGNKIASYIRKEALCTWDGENNRKTSYNLYTLKFTLLLYHTDDRIHPRTTHGWLSSGGAPGVMKVYRGRNPPDSRYVGLMKRTPEIDQMYFWICREYPDGVITVRYLTQPPRS